MPPPVCPPEPDPLLLPVPLLAALLQGDIPQLPLQLSPCTLALGLSRLQVRPQVRQVGAARHSQAEVGVTMLDASRWKIKLGKT